LCEVRNDFRSPFRPHHPLLEGRFIERPCKYPDTLWTPQSHKARQYRVMVPSLSRRTRTRRKQTVGTSSGVSMSLHVHFAGPFRLCSETADLLADCPLRNGTGLYIWAVKQIAGSYRVSYLGETKKSFYERTKEHIVQTLGGNYRVIDADKMCEGVQHVTWDGLWRKATRDKLPDFLFNYEAFAPLIKRYLFGHDIFVAPLDCDVRLQRRVEGALAQQLRSSVEASSLLPSDIRYAVRSADEVAVTVLVSADADIEGLPQEMLA